MMERLRRAVRGQEAAMRRRVIKRFHPPGTTPGTLTPTVEAVAGPTNLTLFVYGPGKLDERPVSALSEVPSPVPPGEQAWLRVVGHDASVLKELATRFGVHALVVEDIANVGQRPKVEQYESYLFVVIDVLRFGSDGTLREQQVSLLLFEKLLVTVEEHESDLFKLVVERLRAQGGKMRQFAVDYLAYALVDAAVDHYFPTLEHVGEQIDAVEDVLLDKPDRKSFEELHRIKRDLLRMRKATWPLREMVGALARTDSPLVREGTRVWLRDVYDHAVQVIDIVETFREMTQELADLYLSSVSNRMNEIMKTLTLFATVFMPLTFIVGVYGMNFQYIPELAWRWGYAAVWVVMLLVAAGMAWMFRRRGWL
jgi:magnesium transporter